MEKTRAGNQVVQTVPLCPYEQRTGNCLARSMCYFRHSLNTNAPAFQPKSRGGTGIVAAVPAPTAFIPAEMSTEKKVQYIGYPPPGPTDEYEYAEREEGVDDQGWCEQCRDCPCCGGFVYQCSGEVCSTMNACYCKMQLDMEVEAGASQ